MKRILITVGIATLVLVLGSTVALQTSHAQTPVATPVVQTASTREVTVSGHGEVSITPDQATVLVGVQTTAATATEALTKNSQQMQAVINALKQAGVANQDIQTQVLQLNPVYPNNPNPTSTPQQPTGFNANNTVQVTIRNLNNLGSILGTVVSAGGNTIQNISFGVSNQSAALDQARQQAMQDARHKADQLASLANTSVGEVLNITETSAQPIPFARASAQVASGNVPVQSGTQTVSVDVQVTWQLTGNTTSAPVIGLTQFPTQTPTP